MKKLVGNFENPSSRILECLVNEVVSHILLVQTREDLLYGVLNMVDFAYEHNPSFLFDQFSASR